MKKKDNRLIYIGLSIIVILMIIVLCLKISNKEPDYTEMTEEEVSLAIKEEQEDIRKKNLATLDEGDRIENYASYFMDRIDNEEYEEAYNMLYEEYRNTYFPTLVSFEEYAKETFPKLMTIEHTNIERNGNIYVIWTTIYDLMKSRDSGVEIKFVIQENGLDDFVLSFSVI